MRRTFFFLIPLLCSSIGASAFTPTSDGLYAVFNVSLRQSSDRQFATKEFAAQLYFQQAPVTVANFVGLAEGVYDWYDFESQTLQSNTPFFDGTQVHRIVPNFIIQAGSPDGTSNGGPGWNIPDEIVPELKHEGGGVLSMANAAFQGTNLNSGGSQFFITMTPFLPGHEERLASLDGLHTVFGQIVEGLNVALEVGRVPLTGSRPHADWPVTIESVKIIRQGAAAQAFNPTDYWQPPTFRRGNLEISFTDQDHDENPDTARIPVLEWRFLRDRNHHYYIEDSDDLKSWSLTHDFARAETVRDIPIRYDISVADASDGRHFYRMLELIHPPLPLPPGQGDFGTNLTLQLEQVEVASTVPYLPESLSFSLLSNNQGYWELKRSDNDVMSPIGEINSYQWWNLADKHQVTLQLDGFTSMQVYLTPTSENSGDAFVHYLSARPEGTNISGTYSLSSESMDRTPIDKNGLNLMFDLDDSDLQGNSFTTTFDIDFWDQIQNQESEAAIPYEGGWKVTYSNSDFVDVGRLVYKWLEGDDKIQLLLNFDFLSDIHLQLDSPLAASGSANAYFRTGGMFETVAYTSGIGDDRPENLDKNLTRLTLNIDLDNDQTWKIVADFYDNAEGKYESTRTDQEEATTGTITFYEWFESDDETWVELAYDGQIFNQPFNMHVFLTETSPDSGTAKVQILENRSIFDATYTIGPGDPKPES